MLSHYGDIPNIDVIFFTYNDVIFGVITHNSSGPYQVFTSNEYEI
jgi:hypothetical protein